jgi:hypothetical protein
MTPPPKPSAATSRGAPKSRRLTRAEVARRLGVHITSVRRYEHTGKLHPKKDPRGVRYFDEAELDAFAKSRGATSQDEPPGASIARVFELIADGKELPDIVIATGLTPSRVRALYVEFITPIQCPVPSANEAAHDTDTGSAVTRVRRLRSP